MLALPAGSSVWFVGVDVSTGDFRSGVLGSCGSGSSNKEAGGSTMFGLTSSGEGVGWLGCGPASLLG